MKILIFLSFCVLIIPGQVWSQVGIGTSTPTSTLDVNGTVRISSLPIIDSDNYELSSLTAGNKFRRAQTGATLVIENNELITAPVARVMGTSDISGATTTWNDLDLKINDVNVNKLATFIKLINYSTNKNITGIAGGTHGRKMALYMNGTANITFVEESPNSLPQNRLVTLATSGLQVGPKSFIELVYDATANGGEGRWLIIKYKP